MTKPKKFKWYGTNVIKYNGKGKSNMTTCPVCGSRLEYWQNLIGTLTSKINLDGSFSKRQYINSLDGDGFGGIECSNLNCRMNFDYCFWDEGVWANMHTEEPYTKDELEDMRDRYLSKSKPNPPIDK